MTTLERMARAWLNQHSGGDVWPEDVPAPPWLALRMRMISDGRLLPTNDRDRAALAVLREEQAPDIMDDENMDALHDEQDRAREEQAPRWDAPTSDPLTSDTMADALATLEEESARLDAGHVAALGINPRRAHIVSVAPPPPCATCGGTGRVELRKMSAAPGAFIEWMPTGRTLASRFLAPSPTGMRSVLTSQLGSDSFPSGGEREQEKGGGRQDVSTSDQDDRRVPRGCDCAGNDDGADVFDVC